MNHELRRWSISVDTHLEGKAFVISSGIYILERKIFPSTISSLIRLLGAQSRGAQRIRGLPRALQRDLARDRGGRSRAGHLSDYSIGAKFGNTPPPQG